MIWPRCSSIDDSRRRFESTFLRLFRPFLFGLMFLAPLFPAFAEEAPSAVTRRSARALWTNTRLLGSPDPPPPYTIEQVFTGIQWKSPMFIAPLPGSAQLLVVLQGGDADRPARIVLVPDDPDTTEATTFLEVEERLIYALTFHPKFEANGYIYVFSNGPWGNEAERFNRVSRYTLSRDTVSRDSSLRCDPASELSIIEWRSAGHDGGDLAFGQDGMLYITSGDGTGDSDTNDTGQNLDDLLATLIRIDVDHPAADGKPYTVPQDNPFVEFEGARPEIWAYGFRNPWRMCVDQRTGDIWVGNNGQDLWETAHLVRRGDNVGWSVYEGSHPFYLQRQRGPTPIVPPTIEHPHSEFRSLTGGVVYYGSRFPELEGAYLYGDHSTGKIWGARHRDGKLTWSQELADTPLQIAGFCVDQRGELLVVDYGGGLYRLVPNEAPLVSTPFPTWLSETGLFASTVDHRPAPGLIPYEVNAPGWADGATAKRFMALPGEEQIAYTSSRGWTFPNQTVLVQTLSIATTGTPTSAAELPHRRIETRILVRQQNEWAGYTYRWNLDQSDAELVPREGSRAELDFDTANASAGKLAWKFPSRTECLECHSRAANFVLGLTELQMNRAGSGDGTAENQLAALENLGLFSSSLPKPPAELPKLANPYDASQALEARARSYLHANCSVCHVAAGGGNAQMELEFTTEADQMKLHEARPQHDTFGIANAMLVSPGNPEQSVLLHRLSRRGRGQMPPLVTAAVDERAVELFREWIAQLKPQRAFVREWTMDDLLPRLAELKAGRSLEAGKALFQSIGCVQCHRFAGDGGAVGPDLSDVARRLTLQNLLESIVIPSKVIPPQYATTVIATEEGSVLTGRVEREDEQSITIRTGALLAETVTIPQEQVAERALSEVSNMPNGTINVLKLEEILDLLAYLLLSDGMPPTSDNP